MMNVVELETERLRLRQWGDSGYSVFADMNAGLDMMVSVLSQTENNAMVNRLRGLNEVYFV